MEQDQIIGTPNFTNQQRSPPAAPGKPFDSSHDISNVSDTFINTHSPLSKKQSERVEANDQIVEDLYLKESDDPMMCSQYAEEYFEYLYEIETEYMCPPNYMDNLKDITWEKRAALVDWLVDVHSKFDMVPEIIFLSVNLLDRFLSKMTVKDKKLQLIGATSLLISAKFEQKFIPKISELVYLAANAFTSDEVAESERYILTVVDFDINYPNPLNFLRRFSMADSYNKEHRLAAKYLLELSLLNHEFIRFRSSLIAASAIYLARLILHNLVWNETLQFYSKYKEDEMMPCIQLFITTLGTPTKFEAVDKKYSHINHFKISEFCRGWILDRHQKVTKFKEFKLV